MLKCVASVIWRININALNLSSVLLLQCLQGEQVIAKYQLVIKNVDFGHFVTSVIGKLRVFQKNSGFKLGTLVFTSPGQFKFRFAHSGLLLNSQILCICLLRNEGCAARSFNTLNKRWL